MTTNQTPPQQACVHRDRLARFTAADQAGFKAIADKVRAALA